MRTALLGILGIAALLAQPANAQDDNPCRAAMSCDCPGISAGILTGGWRADCKACEANILEKCAQSYRQHGDMERALNEAGFCKRNCSVYGDGAFPDVPPASKTEAPAESIPPRPGVMRLLCAFGKSPQTERIGTLEFTGCNDKRGKRNGLWKAYDPEHKVLIEILYRDGKEISRRERQVG